MTWRDKARPIISAVIAKYGRENMPLIRKALHGAYPWNPDLSWPRKAWNAEIRAQLAGPKTRTYVPRPRKRPATAPGQGELL